MIQINSDHLSTIRDALEYRRDAALRAFSESVDPYYEQIADACDSALAALGNPLGEALTGEPPCPRAGG